MNEIYKKINDTEYEICMERIAKFEEERKMSSSTNYPIFDMAIMHNETRIEQIKAANVKNEPVMPEVFFEFQKLKEEVEDEELSDYLLNEIKKMNERFTNLKELLLNNEPYEHLISSIKDYLDIFNLNYSLYIDPDCRCEMEEDEKALQEFENEPTVIHNMDMKKLRIENCVEYLVKEKYFTMVNDDSILILNPRYSLPHDNVMVSENCEIRYPENLDAYVRIFENTKSASAIIETDSQFVFDTICKCVDPDDLFILEQ